MKAIKNSFSNLFQKNIKSKHINKINDAIVRTSTIVFHTYNFLSLYFMDLYEHNKPFPIINETFIHTIMLIVSNRKDNRGNNVKEETLLLVAQFMDFYDEHYARLVLDDDFAYDDKISQILNYQCIDIVKNINVNIAEHYVQHVFHLVNATFDVKNKVSKINHDKKLTTAEKKIKTSAIWKEFRKVKDDLLMPSYPKYNDKYQSDPKYHAWIYLMRIVVTPCKNEYMKDSIPYDVKATAQDYLLCMFEINRMLGLLNRRIDEDIYCFDEENKNLHHKLFHVLPLRTSIIPKNITIDTTALINLLIEKNKPGYIQHVEEKAHEVWSMIFNLEDKIYQKKGYRFHYMIHTNGVSCSLLFIKLDKNKQPCKKPTKKQRKEFKENNDCEYIENAEITSQMKNMLVVAIDPNHGNLISCLAETNQKVTKKKIIYTDAKGKKKTFINRNYLTFRYTRCQRNAETKKNKYQAIREGMKKATKINNISVKKIEKELSNHNSKDCRFEQFTDYLEAKIRTNRALKKFYERKIHRKLVWNTYINTQKSESKMLRAFRKKFDIPGNVLILFGDYDRLYTMHGCEPHISKRMRSLLKNYGYLDYKINECNTSKLCNKCQHEMDRFKKIKGKDGKNHLSWSLLRCTNVNCKTIHNRDLNAPRNMLKIGRSVMAGNGRPPEYQRQQS